MLASVDTGVDYAHPDLAANMWHNPGEIAGNGLDDDGNGYVDDIYGIASASDAVDPSDPMDVQGHGTHTAGTMAGVGDNGAGVTGVAWRASIMALRFFSADGLGATSDAIACIDYVVAMKQRGVNVVAINASWGDTDDSAFLRYAISPPATPASSSWRLPATAAATRSATTTTPCRTTRPPTTPRTSSRWRPRTARTR